MGVALQSDVPFTSGMLLGNILGPALQRHRETMQERDYANYRRRAMSMLRRWRSMPRGEWVDARFFECRACGFDPLDSSIHCWFWGLGDDSRRTLVILSRKMRVRFCSAKDLFGQMSDYP